MGPLVDPLVGRGSLSPALCVVQKVSGRGPRLLGSCLGVEFPHGILPKQTSKKFASDPPQTSKKSLQKRFHAEACRSTVFQEWPRQTKPKKGRFMNFSQGQFLTSAFFASTSPKKQPGCTAKSKNLFMPKKPLTRVSKRVPGDHRKRGLERGWQQGWRRVGEGLAKGWRMVGGFPCTLKFCNFRNARLDSKKSGFVTAWNAASMGCFQWIFER